METNLGKIAAELFEAKKTKTQLNADLKDINSKIHEIEMRLLKEMQEQKLHKISDNHGTVYIARQVVPKVVNWDLFYDYIQEHAAFEMLERRPSRAAFREQFELGVQIPGVDPVEFDEVRTRSS